MLLKHLIIKKIATTSMTSIPKPLKFLGPHYKALIQFYDGDVISTDKASFADVLSCLAIVIYINYIRYRGCGSTQVVS